MVQRLTYKRRHAYRTRSNKVRIIRTPGGRLTFAYLSKRTNAPRCGDCKMPLQGLSVVHPKHLRTLPKRHRRVTRAYGGSRCATCVRERIVRAFLIEEQKIVKAVLRQRSGGKKAEAIPAVTAK